MKVIIMLLLKPIKKPITDKKLKIFKQFLKEEGYKIVQYEKSIYQSSHSLIYNVQFKLTKLVQVFILYYKYDNTTNFYNLLKLGYNINDLLLSLIDKYKLSNTKVSYICNKIRPEHEVFCYYVKLEPFIGVATNGIFSKDITIPLGYI